MPRWKSRVQIPSPAGTAFRTPFTVRYGGVVVSDNTPHSEVATLAALVERYQKSYYRGAPEVSDAEFDALWERLKALDAAHPIFERVGSDRDEAHAKRRHIIFMNSQDKAATPESFLKWATKVAHPQWIAQYKLDGVSVELQYRAGFLRYAITRGDGWVGDDITANVRRVPGVPAQVVGSFSGGVRGEILMGRSVHAEHYPHFANSRNTTAGIVKRLDGAGCEHLHIVCYDARASEGGYFSDALRLLAWLKEQRFAVAEWRVCATPQEVVRWHAEVSAARAHLDVDIDGVVVKGVALDASDALRVRPEKQIAFKFVSEEQETTLRRVEWSQSGHLYTPIAVTDPVRLAGTTVQRANLVNPRLIRELALRIGSTIAISKRGEIIPKIERLISNDRATEAIEVPTECYECGSALVLEDMRVYCPNARCPQLIIRRVRRWIEVLDIKEFGEVLIEQLFRAGAITGVADLYSLRVEEIAGLERQGQRSAEKALENLRAVRSLPLARFVAACDIENVGEITMNKIVAAGYHTLRAICESTVERLSEIEGIAELFAATILKGIRERIVEMEEIVAASQITLELPVVSALSGSSFCFTGALTTLKRSEAEKMVVEAGGSIKKSVTKGLRYLVTNDQSGGSSKLAQAARYGTTIISEEQFLQMVAVRH